MNLPQLRLAGLLCLAVFATGCRGNGTVPVTGTVTLDGKALANAVVTFEPAEGKGNRIAIGTTDQQGVFKLTSFDKDDGALPGQYKVTITLSSGAVEKVDLDKMVAMGKSKKSAQPKAKSEIHPNYMNVSKTPLKQTIPAEGKIEFALKSDGT